MGGVTSVPQLIGNLVTRLFYSLIGANYNSRSISAARGDNPLEKWRGRDYHVYHRFGWAINIFVSDFYVQLPFLQVTIFWSWWRSCSWVLWGTDSGGQSCHDQAMFHLPQTWGLDPVPCTKTALWFPSCDYVQLVHYILSCLICIILINHTLITLWIIQYFWINILNQIHIMLLWCQVSTVCFILNRCFRFQIQNI